MAETLRNDVTFILSCGISRIRKQDGNMDKAVQKRSCTHHAQPMGKSAHLRMVNLSSTGSDSLDPIMSPIGQDNLHADELMMELIVSKDCKDVASFCSYWVNSQVFSGSSDSVANPLSMPLSVGLPNDNSVSIQFHVGDTSGLVAGNMVFVTQAWKSKDETIVLIYRQTTSLLKNQFGFPSRTLPGERRILRQFSQDLNTMYPKKIQITKKPEGVRLGKNVSKLVGKSENGKDAIESAKQNGNARGATEMPATMRSEQGTNGKGNPTSSFDTVVQEITRLQIMLDYQSQSIPSVDSLVNNIFEALTSLAYSASGPFMPAMSVAPVPSSNPAKGVYLEIMIGGMPAAESRILFSVRKEEKKTAKGDMAVFTISMAVPPTLARNRATSKSVQCVRDALASKYPRWIRLA